MNPRQLFILAFAFAVLIMLGGSASAYQGIQAFNCSYGGIETLLCDDGSNHNKLSDYWVASAAFTYDQNKWPEYENKYLLVHKNTSGSAYRDHNRTRRYSASAACLVNSTGIINNVYFREYNDGLASIVCQICCSCDTGTGAGATNRIYYGSTSMGGNYKNFKDNTWTNWSIYYDGTNCYFNITNKSVSGVETYFTATVNSAGQWPNRTVLELEGPNGASRYATAFDNIRVTVGKASYAFSDSPPVISGLLPLTGTVFLKNTENVNFTYSDSDMTNANCTLFIDGKINQTRLDAKNNKLVNFSVVAMSNKKIQFYVTCQNKLSTTSATINTYLRPFAMQLLQPLNNTWLNSPAQFSLANFPRYNISVKRGSNRTVIYNGTSNYPSVNIAFLYNSNYTVNASGCLDPNVCWSDYGKVKIDTVKPTITKTFPGVNVSWSNRPAYGRCVDSNGTNPSGVSRISLSALNMTGISFFSNTSDWLLNYSGSSKNLSFSIICNDSARNKKTQNFSVSFDTISPACIGISNQDVAYGQAYFWNVLCHDDIFLYMINISCYGATYYKKEILNINATQYNFLDSTGILNTSMQCFWTVADAHTNKDITKSINKFSVKADKKSIKIMNHGLIEYSGQDDQNIVLNFSKNDRVGFKVIRPKSVQDPESVFFVKAKQKITYIESELYHGWFVVDNKYWIDFDNIGKVKPKIWQVNETSYAVELPGADYAFSSFGLLNVQDYSQVFSVKQPQGLEINVCPSTGANMAFLLLAIMISLVLMIWLSISKLVLPSVFALMFCIAVFAYFSACSAILAYSYLFLVVAFFISSLFGKHN